MVTRARVDRDTQKNTLVKHSSPTGAATGEHARAHYMRMGTDYYASLCDSSSSDDSTGSARGSSNANADENPIAVASTHAPASSRGTTGSARVIGASIIPVMRDPTFHNMYVVLGRERRSPQWAVDSDVWCDYGGSVHWHDDGVEDEYACAAREAWEETCALLRFSEHDELPLASCRPLEEKLRRGEYLCHLVFAQHSFEYHTFTVLVPWDPGFPRRFQHTVRALRYRTVANSTTFMDAMRVLRHPAVLMRACGVMHVDPAFTEKTAAHLFSLPLLERSLANDPNARVHRLLRVYAIRRSFRPRLRAWMQCFRHLIDAAPTTSATMTLLLPPAPPLPHNPSTAAPAERDKPTRAAPFVEVASASLKLLSAPSRRMRSLSL